MGYSRLKELVDESYLGGKSWLTALRKVPASSSVQGTAADLSMAPGYPRPNYYVGAELTSTVFELTRSLYVGAACSPEEKYLRKAAILAVNAGVVPAAFTLCDYLLFYPLVDMDLTDEQEMINTTTLPRYATGAGVQMMVVATNPYVGGGTFFVEYTNQDGVSGRVTPVITSNTTTAIGSIIHSGPHALAGGLFMPLAPGDSGVRSANKITFLTGNGGIASIVLVKPIGNVWVREAGCWSEYDFLMDKVGMPRIYDGACLNYVAQVNGNVTGQTIMGYVEVVWN